MRYVVALLCLLSLGGCSVLEAHVERMRWHASAAYTSAAVRLITQRHNPMSNTDGDCGESPSGHGQGPVNRPQCDCQELTAADRPPMGARVLAREGVG